MNKKKKTIKLVCISLVLFIPFMIIGILYDEDITLLADIIRSTVASIIVAALITFNKSDLKTFKSKLATDFPEIINTFKSSGAPINSTDETNDMNNCFCCGETITSNELYCSKCGMPRKELYNEISHIVVRYCDLCLQCQLDSNFNTELDIKEFGYCELTKLSELCNHSVFVIPKMQELLSKDICEHCVDDFYELLEDDKAYQRFCSRNEKEFDELEKQIKKGKITKSQYKKATNKLNKSIEEYNNKLINHDFPTQLLDGIEKIIYVNAITKNHVYDEKIQLEIRDIIEAESKTVQKRLNELHNSSILQSEEYASFEEEVKLYENIYNEETHDFVNSILAAMRRKSKITVSNTNDDIFSFDELNDLDGWAFEEWCANVLKANGFINIEVTPKSGDNGADIIAEKDDITYSIQCKKYQSPVGVSAVQEINTSRGMYNSDIAVVMTNSTFTPQAIKLAQSVNVKLWDGNKVADMAKKLKQNNLQ